MLTVLLIVIAAGLFWCARRLLFPASWLVGWLRGSCGLILCVAALAVLLAAYDIYSYRHVVAQESVATISFRQLAPQHYMATFADKNGQSMSFELHGDQWQLDSRMLQWDGLFHSLGLNTVYRLEKISGRYLVLGEIGPDTHREYRLTNSKAGIDLWRLLYGMGNTPMFKALRGNSTYLPMVDKGQYQVRSSFSGLLVNPLNQPAKDAVNQWR